MRGMRKPGFVAVNAFTVLLFALLLWLMMAFIDSQRAVKLQAALEAESTAFTNAVSEKIHASVDGLRAVASLLVAFEDVDYQTFSRFAGRYLEADRGLLIMEWQPKVLAEDREDFVAIARERGLPDFELWQPDAEGNPVAAAERAVYVPVLYMLSRHPGTDTTGLDLAWSPVRMESKWLARDTGQPQSSVFFRVVTNVDDSYAPVGLAITLPIYRDGVIPPTRAEREDQLLGYLAGIYAVDELLVSEIDNLAGRGFNIAVRDASGSGIGVSRMAGLASEHDFVSQMMLFGNEWSLALAATQSRAAQEEDPVWLVLPIATVLLGFLVLVFLYLLENKNLALERTQRELSTALSRARKSESFLRELARRDQLTGLLNRRALFDQLTIELKRSGRHGFLSALLMLDLDFFKQINDRYGHPAGDEVLKRFSAMCQETARATDVVARLGGEEFAILLPQTDHKAALVIAERLRERVEHQTLDIDAIPDPVHLTVSIGLAVSSPGVTGDQLIASADAALYQAKQSGRNCVRVAVPDVLRS